MAQQYESYTKVRELGSGSFGKAFLVKWQSDDSYAVIKQIDIHSIKSTKEKKQIDQEGKLLEQLNHANIIGFREVYKTKKGKICIVMDYADGGDLSDKIKKAKENFDYLSEDEILRIFTQIWLGIKHIHDRKIIHRDLKAQNIFLMKNGTIKLGDFGIAKVLEQTVAQAETQVGTPYYISPEIIKGRKYSLETDIWSLGIILYELWALDVPIKARNLHELYMKISNCKKVPRISTKYSQDLQDLVDEILWVNPSRRPNINQILKKPLLKNKVKQFLDDEDYQQEFSHTILHNQYLFEQRKKNRPSHHQSPSEPPSQKYQQANLPKVIESESPIIIQSVAPEPKQPNWVKQSPRALGGFVGHKPISSRKPDPTQAKFRPASGKPVPSIPSSGKKPNTRPQSNMGVKGLVIQGEEIKPIINKNDGKRRIMELLDSGAKPKAPKQLESEQKGKQEFDIIGQEKNDNDKIKMKIKNIYSIDTKEEQVKGINELVLLRFLLLL